MDLDEWEVKRAIEGNERRTFGNIWPHPLRTVEPKNVLVHDRRLIFHPFSVYFAFERTFKTHLIEFGQNSWNAFRLFVCRPLQDPLLFYMRRNFMEFVLDSIQDSIKIEIAHHTPSDVDKLLSVSTLKSSQTIWFECRLKCLSNVMVIGYHLCHKTITINYNFRLHIAIRRRVFVRRCSIEVK